MTDKENLKYKSIILENWQDEKFSYRLSFDGLLNFSGQKKPSYFKVAEIFGKKPRRDFFTAKILKPAVPLIPGSKSKYSAALFEADEWFSGTILEEENLHFEWWLIKNDIFGNPLAAKKLNEGPIVSIEIPVNYKDFELLLAISKDGCEAVAQHRTTLHTPLYHAVEE